ncbi:MAG TPA: four helix bundle protein [Vicinamibacterales bacterium]|nr:four helix bundle protein [Vicinamibacterales bacterium]
MAGWRRVEEIVAYQASVKLRDEICSLAARAPIAKDFDFKKQIVSAAASAPSNISEGFDLYRHGRFGYHVEVAMASLAEMKNHLEDGRKRGYFDQATADRLEALRDEAKRTATGLLKYLKRSEAPPAAWTQEPPR